jgi:hypothetical protein
MLGVMRGAVNLGAGFGRLRRQVDHWPKLRSPSLPITTQIRAYTLLLPSSLHTFGCRPSPNYQIRHDSPVRTDYYFEYSPPYSPIGEPDPPSAGTSPPLEHIHTLIHEKLSQETLHSNDRPNPSHSPLEADPEARLLPEESPQTQGGTALKATLFLDP